MTTTGGVVGCGEPPAGSTVIPTLSPEESPDTTMGLAIFPLPDMLIIPAGLFPAGLISHSS